MLSRVSNRRLSHILPSKNQVGDKTPVALVNCMCSQLLDTGRDSIVLRAPRVSGSTELRTVHRGVLKNLRCGPRI